VTIKLKVLPRFPAQVTGSVFITITKANGVWTITPDFSLLEVPVIDNLATFETVVRNTITGSYGRVPLTNLLSSSYFATTITGDHNVSPTETYLRCNFSVPSAIILPASATRNGLGLGIKDVTGNFATFAATITPDGSELIDGLASLTANQNYQYIELRPNDAGWEIIHFG